MTPVRVTTFMKNGKPWVDTVIDHDIDSHRKWLRKHLLWAFRNSGTRTELVPTDDPVTFISKGNR